MLKRLLVAAVVAASTLVVSGTISTQSANASGPLSISADRSAVSPGIAKASCRWVDRYGDWCKQCYKYGKWRLEYCKDKDESDNGYGGY
ncbi:hypothetical protein SAMN05421505_13738 [Sinosporangium album]|uniref:Uncharacterized protein n=1 Tax=Sinosporangium album TaxID=504805 RepID=A0A1G8II75_9ACTN|nr:hypothetical protein [Sinosporangium album]SDI18605.1 hypothetical protein SAMN05421505_13738 [Sinosporangium album]